ncbi:hypothetical protein DIDNDMLP_00446 [Klebsiella phage KP13-7]|nr:hypothetical protein DIDNDMLP_00446 [Klebsiella phage KP13-7]
MIRDQELTVCLYIGTDKDELNYYHAISFTFPIEDFKDVSMIES